MCKVSYNKWEFLMNKQTSGKVKDTRAFIAKSLLGRDFIDH